MKNRTVSFVLLTVLSVVFIFQSCKGPCEGKLLPTPDFGSQTFSVEYVHALNGKNYLSQIYNINNVVVSIDYTGGERPNLAFDERLFVSPGDTTFGPFNFTARYIDSVTKEPLVWIYNSVIKHDYYIKKDTFGIDKITVEFVLSQDKCNTLWRAIKYYRNDELLPQYNMKENAKLVFVE